jgi:hypothetical protein
MTGLVWVFVLVVVPTFLSGWIAERRGRATRLWYWLGAIFGPIAPLVVALLPPASEPGSRPPGPTLRGVWRRTLGRASGERSAGDTLVLGGLAFVGAGLPFSVASGRGGPTSSCGV